MEISVIGRQALLYGHILAFALAMATILKEDARLVLARNFDSAALLASAKLVKWLLLALWVTGVPMVIMDVGTNLVVLLNNPKLIAKLIVVGVLTLNGVMLHLVVFPTITVVPKNPRSAATIAATLGAVSTASWLCAFLVGAARLVGPYCTLGEFIFLYILVLALAVVFGIVVVRNRLERLLRATHATSNVSVVKRTSISAALLDAEIAALALGDIQRRMRMNQEVRRFPVERRGQRGNDSSDSEITNSLRSQDSQLKAVVNRRRV